jgi:hypothetical protein
MASGFAGDAGVKIESFLPTRKVSFFAAIDSQRIGV